MSKSTNGLAEYEVEVNGITHVFQLDDEAAKKTPGAKRVRAARIPEPPSPPRENANTRTGTEPSTPVLNVPTDEQRAQAAARDNEVAQEQRDAEADGVVNPAPTQGARKTAARRPASKRAAKKAAAPADKARGAENK